LECRNNDPDSAEMYANISKCTINGELLIVYKIMCAQNQTD